MKLKTLAISAGMFALVAAAMAPIAMRATSTQAASGKAEGTPNFTGFWVIDRKNSDKPPQGGGGEHKGGGGGGHHGGGEWSGPPPGGPGGPDGGGGRGGGMRRMLPPKMRITTSDQGISVADSAGTIVQDIRFGSVDGDGAQKQPPQFGSSWKGDKLLVTHQGPRGAVTEEFDLDGDGKRLVIETTMQGKGGEKRTMKRVYLKKSAL
jgi:hypothetical protein